MTPAAKTIAQKARVKAGTRIAVLHPEDEVVRSLGLPADAAFVQPGEAQLLFVFVHTRAELEARMPVSPLRQHGPVW